MDPAARPPSPQERYAWRAPRARSPRRAGSPMRTLRAGSALCARFRTHARALLAGPILIALCTAQEIPYHQDRPPNQPYSPAEAIARMEVPDGFRVELVAAEPDLVNPVAMCFDERGRIWVTESVEYPRFEPGPGRDRVKVLEDTDGDGQVDEVTVFQGGLNIPSGIAVGHGGVWVANAPDILLLKDTDGDGRADVREVVVTGFGRDDTHELPNSLTWGPDGWLYGLNGVFNHSVVRHQGNEHRFTCALFRIHPRTRAFEVFSEGTSNPWGIAFDGEGSAFVSACVIDHLWHLTETGYYQRQAGAYPPHTWRIGSIVDHRHQKAAYCGIEWLDSDAYPEPFRGRLYMGNIHGNCINVDRLTRDGSTYVGHGEADFLVANDAWFMPVAQKVGPDGCLYVLDWYDRYHCYQDARRDPEGIDRLKGRLYRIRHTTSPRVASFDLARETDAELIARLASANVFVRRTAQRLLVERDDAVTRARLEDLVLESTAPRPQRLHALWTLISSGALRADFHRRVLAHDDPTFRAWAVRAAGDAPRVGPAIRQAVVEAAADASSDVQLQVAIGARKIEGTEPIDLLADVLAHAGQDELIPRIVWRNLWPLLESPTGRDRFLTRIADVDVSAAPALALVIPRAVDLWLGGDAPPVGSVVDLLDRLWSAGLEQGAVRCLGTLVRMCETGRLAGPELLRLRAKLEPVLTRIRERGDSMHLRVGAALLAAAWSDPDALAVARDVFSSAEHDDARRTLAFEALLAARDRAALDAVAGVLRQPEATPAFRRAVLSLLGHVDEPRVARVVLDAYDELPAALRPAAIDLLVQRAPWRRALVDAVENGSIEPAALHANQVRALRGGDDGGALAARVAAIWGQVRDDRREDREAAIARARRLCRTRSGDPRAGVFVFEKACAQCHRIWGEGQDLGPDLTGNGRGSFEQLLSNVLDPNLVVGEAYRMRAIETHDGRLVAGTVVERDAQRVVLQLPGGETESIPASQVKVETVSPLSLMPEALETTLTEQELVDLFAFLSLDRPPDDPAAKPIPGAPGAEPRASTDPADFAALVEKIAPGFTTRASGEGGVALLREHLGRRGVLRTHPVDRTTPCVLERTVALPPDAEECALSIQVAHHARDRYDWRLIVRANGVTVHDSIVSPEVTEAGWRSIEVELSRFAGQTVRLELHNHPNDWNYEFGYWGDVAVTAGGRRL